MKTFFYKADGHVYKNRLENGSQFIVHVNPESKTVNLLDDASWESVMRTCDLAPISEKQFLTVAESVMNELSDKIIS